MISVPTTCVDDFYSNPNAVREFALKQKFEQSSGGYPGLRTVDISLIDKDFFTQFSNKIFSLFVNDISVVQNYHLRTSFQLIKKFDNDPLSPKNKGWIHFDSDAIFAGIIYLSPNISPNTGTSIFRLTNESTLDHSECKQIFYEGLRVPDNYDQIITRHNSSYTETIRFDNVYNRMICFDATQAHGVNSFYTEDEPRLTQVFFVHALESGVEPPIMRHRKFL